MDGQRPTVAIQECNAETRHLPQIAGRRSDDGAGSSLTPSPDPLTIARTPSGPNLANGCNLLQALSHGIRPGRSFLRSPFVATRVFIAPLAANAAGCPR